MRPVIYTASPIAPSKRCNEYKLLQSTMNYSCVRYK